MTLHLKLPPDVEAKLRHRAAASGLPVEQLVRQALEAQAVDAPAPVRQSGKERASRWNETVERLRAMAGKNMPPGHALVDSRESIYDGRGE